MKDMYQKGRGGYRNLPRGTEHHNARFNEVAVRVIRFLYETGRYSQDELAAVYKTSQAQVWNIVNRKTWTHVC